MADILYQEESYQIQGAIFEVYKELGTGFLESVYQECLEKEFVIRNIPFERQAEFKLTYKGQPLQQYFKADLICYKSIIIELKTVKTFDPIHRAMPSPIYWTVINYFKVIKNLFPETIY